MLKLCFNFHYLLTVIDLQISVPVMNYFELVIFKVCCNKFLNRGEIKSALMINYELKHTRGYSNMKFNLQICDNFL